MSLNLFHHIISFAQPDPLDNGLREEIEAEQLEPEAIVLDSMPSEDEQEQYWSAIVRDTEPSAADRFHAADR